MAFPDMHTGFVETSGCSRRTNKIWDFPRGQRKLHCLAAVVRCSNRTRFTHRHTHPPHFGTRPFTKERVKPSYGELAHTARLPSIILVGRHCSLDAPLTMAPFHLALATVPANRMSTIPRQSHSNCSRPAQAYLRLVME